MKFKIGDKVRVKRSVDEPLYGWGNVTHNSVGVIKYLGYRYCGKLYELLIDFPEQDKWYGAESEMKFAEGYNIKELQQNSTVPNVFEERIHKRATTRLDK